MIQAEVALNEAKIEKCRRLIAEDREVLDSLRDTANAQNAVAVLTGRITELSG
jgi:transcription termination factor Rho